MKISSLLLIALGFAVTGSSAWACSSGFYPFACRAKIGLSIIPTGANGQLGDSIQVRFKKTTFGFGAGYAKLPAGSCAWQDRGVSNTEPAEVDYPVIGNFTVTDTQSRALIQCAGDSTCLFQGCAMNYPGSGVMGFDEQSPFQTIYP